MPRPVAAAHTALTVENYRTRFGPSRDGIQVSVANDGSVPLTVVTTVLMSEAMAGPASSDRVVDIPAGARRDIPLVLPDVECSREPALDYSQVQLTLRSPGGTEVTVRDVLARDRLGQLAAWWQESCLAEEVARRTTLSVLLPELPSASAESMELDLVAVPVGSGFDAPLSIVAISGTVLISLLDDTGAVVDRRPIDLVMEPTDGVERRAVIPAVPARCDAHAIAEDKQGTLFRVDVAIADRRGTVTVAADDRTKDRVYAAVRAMCAGTGDGDG